MKSELSPNHQIEQEDNYTRQVIRELEAENARLRAEIQQGKSTYNDLHLLLHNLPIRIFVVSPEGIVLDTLGNGYPLVNNPTREMKAGDNFLERTAYSPQLHTDFYRALKGEPFASRFTFQPRHFDFFYTPIFDNRKNLTGVHIIVVDVSDKIKPQDELNRFKQLAEKAFDIGKLGFWELDLKNESLEWSASVDKMYNLNPVNFSPSIHNALKLINEKDRKLLIDNHKQWLQDGQSLTLEMVTGISHNIPEKLVRLHADFAKDEAGNATKVFGIIQDITIAKMQEMEIANARERMNNLLQSISNPFFALDRDWQIIFANAPALKLLNIGLANKQNIWELMPLWTGTKLYLQLKKVMNENVSISFEQFLTQNQAWYDIHAFPGKDGISILFNTITERKNLEFTLKQLNNSKDRFFSIIAHDLRSPMSSIMGLTDKVVNENRQLDPEKLENSLSYLNNAVRNVYKLLDNLMQWARLQMNELQVYPGIYNLKETLAFNIELFKPKAREKNIKIEDRTSPDINFYADKDMIETVFRNLISNAMKFTNQGGRLTIDAVNFQQTIKVSLTDTGIGIPSDLQSRLFDVDMKNSRPGTEGEEGTGLGLKLCKDLLTKNNGNISVESRPGEGSCFFVTLPSIPG